MLSYPGYICKSVMRTVHLNTDLRVIPKNLTKPVIISEHRRTYEVIAVDEIVAGKLGYGEPVDFSTLLSLQGGGWMSSFQKKALRNT